jgi:hypothetical protein
MGQAADAGRMGGQRQVEGRLKLAGWRAWLDAEFGRNWCVFRIVMTALPISALCVSRGHGLGVGSTCSALPWQMYAARATCTLCGIQYPCG